MLFHYFHWPNWTVSAHEEKMDSDIKNWNSSQIAGEYFNLPGHSVVQLRQKKIKGRLKWKAVQVKFIHRIDIIILVRDMGWLAYKKYNNLSSYYSDLSCFANLSRVGSDPWPLWIDYLLFWPDDAFIWAVHFSSTSIWTFCTSCTNSHLSQSLC